MPWVEWKKQLRRTGIEMDVRWWEIVVDRQRQLTSRPAITPVFSSYVSVSTPETWHTHGVTLDLYVPPWASYLWAPVYAYNGSGAEEDRPWTSHSRLVFDGVPDEDSDDRATTKVYDRRCNLISNVVAHRDSYVSLGFQSAAWNNENVNNVVLYAPGPQPGYSNPSLSWQWYYEVGAAVIPPDEEEPGPGIAPETVVLVVEDESELPTPSASWNGARAIIRPGSGYEEEERICIKGSDDVYNWLPYLKGGGGL